MEIRPSGRNETPMVDGVVEYSKSSSIDFEEQVGDKLVAFQEPKNDQQAKGVLQHHRLKTIVLTDCNQVFVFMEWGNL